jgi:hypothetical protein
LRGFRASKGAESRSKAQST